MNLRSPLDHILVFRSPARGRWDLVTPAAILGLSLFGLAFIYSAHLTVNGGGWFTLPTATGHRSLNGWSSQLVWLAMGAAVYWVVAHINYRFWLSVAHWCYGLCLVPLVLVLVVGTRSGGSQRWLHLGPMYFQPSETAKIGVMMITASILIRSKVGTVQQSLGVLGKLALAAGVPIALVLLQPDLKSAIVLPPIVFSMLYVSRLSARFFVVSLGAFLLIVGVIAWDTIRYERFVDSSAASYLDDHQAYSRRFQLEQGKYQKHSWVPLHDYQRNRILSFIAPDEIDPTGIAWNQLQSEISVGSGGVAGTGWTKGTQARLGYLPHSVAHTDFIFSVIAEEIGFLGSITVLSLFGLVLFNGIRIAGLARDRLGTLLAIGVTVLFTVHVFVNIAMTIGLVPITGIPLPFISYGGSFVLSCCLLQGLVQSVYRFRKEFA
ncbi:MAG TPA: FtsW/RodA/SpoVE family cell cycle protein [Opitutaceae bacterium]|nr:FtsW/RodA/SpoVE family cell cycle protein [Opitutaceae bacterium]